MKYIIWGWFTSLVVLLFNLHAITASINVLPGTTVEVGEEVYFDAGGDHADSIAYLSHRYTWYFGDGYSCAPQEPYHLSNDNGRAVTHFFMKPGVYTVTLKAYEINLPPFTTGFTTLVGPYYNDKDGTGWSTLIKSQDTKTVTITVTGQAPRVPPMVADKPLLDLEFENSINDGSGHGHNGVWKNGTGTYVDGMENKALDFNGAYIEVANGTMLDSRSNFTVSFWVKRTSLAQGGFVFEKKGVMDCSIGRGAADSRDYLARQVVVYLTTTAGPKKFSGLCTFMPNTQWHHVAITYNGSELAVYIDGEKYISDSHSGKTASNSNPFLLGKKAAVSEIFNAHLDEFRIYDRVLTHHELFTGFELWHADFHNRIDQYIYAQIPGAVAANATNRLVLELSRNGGSAQQIVNKTGLSTEEKILFEPGKLSAGNYRLVAELRSGSGTVLDRVVDKFTKLHSGNPAVGINRHNGLYVKQADGTMKPFIPVSAFQLGTTYDREAWYRMGAVNTFFGAGFKTGADDNYYQDGWKRAADHAQSIGAKMGGPVKWDGNGHVRYAPYTFEQNASHQQMETYINLVKDHPAFLMHGWDDEPNLGDQNWGVPPAVCRAQTYKTRSMDTNHPMHTSFVARKFTSPSEDRRYSYLKSAHNYGGHKTMITDFIGFDYYAYDYHEDVRDIDEIPSGKSITAHVNFIKKVIEENYDLIPLQVYIECNDVQNWLAHPKGTEQTPPITAAQLKHLCWLSMVHGAKSVFWFQYSGKTPHDNFQAIAEFVRQSNDLAEVIYAPDPEIAVTNNGAAQGAPVDVMVKDMPADNELYIFAVRRTEVPQNSDPAKAVTFTLPGYTVSHALVYEEDRTIAFSGGQFTDTFAPNDVHIYRIPYDGGSGILVDRDGDGYPGPLSNPSSAATDCNDNDPSIHPGAEEVCDGIDNNCSAGIDEGFPANDTDGDGIVYCADNCPEDGNPLQEDFDGDGIGDACDPVTTWFDDFNSRKGGTGDLGTQSRPNQLTWKSVKSAGAVDSTWAALRGDWLADESNAFIVSDQEFQDRYVYACDITAAGGTDAGIVFNYQDPDNYYYFAVSGRNTGNLHLPDQGHKPGSLLKVKNGAFTVVDFNEDLAKDSRSKVFEWLHYQVAVTVKAGQLEMKIERHDLYTSGRADAVATFTDASPHCTGGAVGCYVLYQNTNHTMLDNITVDAGGSFTSAVGPDGIPAADPGSALRFFPNPVLDQLHIDTDQGNGYIQVYSPAGRLVKEIAYTNNMVMWPQHEIPAGIYYLRVNDTSQLHRVMTVAR